MGIVERKEREREHMRKLILEAARNLFLTDGYEKVSIRNIADKIEYSPATIYLYFKDKNELFLALHQLAFRQLIAGLSSVTGGGTPMGKLLEMGQLYIQFAIENPELFDLMFIMNGPMDALACREDSWADGKQAFALLQHAVQECMDADEIAHADAEQLGLLIWSMVHGLSALFIRKRLSILGDQREIILMDRVFEIFAKLLHKKV